MCLFQPDVNLLDFLFGIIDYIDRIIIIVLIKLLYEVQLIIKIS